jgi:site-specific DNA-methyltransferase (adenine-specific)
MTNPSGATLYRGDCLELLPSLASASVHLILSDLPYGTTDCRWDHKIDAAALWREYQRVLVERGVVLLFAQCGFCVELIRAAPKGWLRYEWAWDKRGASGWLNANRRPMTAHEVVLVFGRSIRYFPQGLRKSERKARTSHTSVYGRQRNEPRVQVKTGFPTSLLRFPREQGAAPAQKPVELLSYLIRTYTKRGETVLDNAMGLGSTGVAAMQTGRRFIGMEIDEARYGVAAGRIRAMNGEPDAPSAVPAIGTESVPTTGTRIKQ